MYTPNRDKFVNGTIADGDAMVDELTAISTAIQEAETKATQESSKALNDAKSYADTQLATIDGGTF